MPWQAKFNNFLDQAFGTGLLGADPASQGLLGPAATQQLQQQQRMALTNNILAASAPSATPVNPMARLGMAMQATQLGGQRAMEQGVQSAALATEANNRQQVAAREQSIYQKLQDAFKGADPQTQALVMANPGRALEILTQQKAAPKVEPQNIVDAQGNPKKVVYQVNGQLVDQTGQPYQLQPGEFLGGNVSRERGPLVSVNMPGQQEQTEWDKATGKAFAERYQKLIDSGDAASGNIAQYSLLRDALRGVSTGKFTPFATEVKSGLQSLLPGVNFDELGSAQAATSLSNTLALQLRNPAGGAGMPGSMSDADRQFLVEIAPSTGKSKYSNEVLLEAKIRQEKRSQEVASMADEYVAQNGRLDGKFFKQVREYAQANPLYADLAVKLKPLDVGGTVTVNGAKVTRTK